MQAAMTERDRIISVLKRRKPDRIPWATRLEIWHSSHTRSRTLPAECRDLDLLEIHDTLKLGRQAYCYVALAKLVGVEVSVEFNGKKIFHEKSPVLQYPRVTSLVPLSEPGKTIVSFHTPAGTARIGYKTTPELLAAAATPYMEEHIFKEEQDYTVLSWIAEHCEVVDNYGAFTSLEEEIGEQGFVIGMIGRVPFQEILLDYMGEERCFFELHDNPRSFHRFLARLTEAHGELLETALASPAFMLEFGDNFDGEMTNPNLFAEYCIPHMQGASDRIHAAGKVLGSHMDGDMGNLLALVPETGIDVAESFSPRPLSSVSFLDAWNAWKGRLLIWGGVSSPLFEPGTSDAQFESVLLDILKTIVPGGLSILGIADQAVGPSLFDRIKRAGELIELHGYYP